MKFSSVKWRWSRAAHIHNSQTPNWTFSLPIGVLNPFPSELTEWNFCMNLAPAMDVPIKISSSPPVSEPWPLTICRNINRVNHVSTILDTWSTFLFFAAYENILWSPRICVYAFLSLKGLSVYLLLVYIPRNFAIYLTRCARMHGISTNSWSHCLKIHTPIL
jgi:hypothetical protein